MTEIITGITFSPVQTFIEKSRKLRDLYGSSYLLSYLSWSVCHAAQRQGHQIISPAEPNVIQGMPNKILIAGALSEQEAKTAFDASWSCVTDTCQEWIQERLQPNYQFLWKRDWGLWAKYTWEFFWVQGQDTTVGDVRRQLEAIKQARNWVGINWQGESSTLSGTDAVAHPHMGAEGDPRKLNAQAQKAAIEQFYIDLSRTLGEAFIEATPALDRTLFAANRLQKAELYGAAFVDPDEELNIPELAKRLITHKAIARRVVERVKIKLGGTPPNSQLDVLLQTIETEFNPDPGSTDLNPDPGSFRDLNRLQRRKRRLEPGQGSQAQADNRWTGWFHGDGDRAGSYIDTLDVPGTQGFSEQMRQWGRQFQSQPPTDSRVIYAGGDDFLGVFYRVAPDSKLPPKTCLEFFSHFKSHVWHQPAPKPITVSVGFVWAAPGIPQRDVLQQCREAEKAAKNQGRDRLALRVLFNGGNYLEWVCPWRFLPVLQDYRDRASANRTTHDRNWAHFFNDVAVLEARHAFQGKDDKGKPVNDRLEVALALFNVYFKATHTLDASTTAWNDPDHQAFYNLMAMEGQDCNAPDYWKQEGLWNSEESFDPSAPTKKRLKGGLLGDRAAHTKDHQPDGDLDLSKTRQALTAWMINLAKVGFHLCSDI